MRAYWLKRFVGVLAISATACGDPAGPTTGTLIISVAVTGGGFDLDGFSVAVDAQVQPVAPNGMTYIAKVAPGLHVVSVERLADHCSVTGPQPKSVAVTAGEVVKISVEVQCTPTGIDLRTPTTGVDVPAFYRVAVNNLSAQRLPLNNPATLRLFAGDYTVSLVLPGDNCTIAGGNTQTAVVTPHRLTQVTFDVTCAKRVHVPKIAFALDTTAWGLSTRWVGVVNLDGSGSTLLERGDTPSWSPNGTTLALSDASCFDIPVFDEFECGGSIITLDPESWTQTRHSRWFAIFQPEWSSDGRTMAATLCCDAGVGRLAILIAGDELYTTMTLTGVRKARDPAWKPDGRTIVFACSFPEAPLGSDLCSIVVDGSGLKRLTTLPGRETQPAWSPDGTRVAFTLNDTEIALLSVADGGITRLTNGSEPAWSPDGTQLVFVGENGLFTIDADGSHRQRLTTGSYRSPAWRP
jgi:WD40 repeat protein